MRILQSLLLSLAILFTPSLCLAVVDVDFTGWIEYDPSSDIVVVDAGQVDYNNLEGNQDAWLYQDQGASELGDFSLDLKTYPETITANYADMGIFGVTDSAAQDVDAFTNGFYTFVDKDAGDTFSIKLRKAGDTTLDQSSPKFGAVRRYLTVDRTGTTVSVEVYTDSGRTTLEDTISGTIDEATAYRYTYAICTDTTEGSGQAYGTSEDWVWTPVAAGSTFKPKVIIIQ